MPQRLPNAPRLLGSNDLEACWQLDQRALGGLWSRDQWSRELSEAQRPCLGVIRGERLLAMACGWLVVDELQIGAVAVDPDERRQGLGLRVMTALLSEGRAQGALNATLEVSATNTAAVNLYRQCGFSTAGIRRAYYRNGDDALIQWLSLRNLEEVRIAVRS